MLLCKLAWQQERQPQPQSQTPAYRPLLLPHTFFKKLLKVLFFNTKKATLVSAAHVLHCIVTDKMACLQLAGWQKPFSFLHNDGCLPELLGLLLPAVSFTVPPQHPHLLLLTSHRSLPEETSYTNKLPLLSSACSIYKVPVSLSPPLCSSSPPVFHVMSACLCWATCFFLLTHKSTYREIQREAMSCCISGRPQVQITVAYGDLIGASKKSHTSYPT